MKKMASITVAMVVLLLSSLYVNAQIRFDRVQHALFGERGSHAILNRAMEDVLLPFADRQYYFHAAMTGSAEDARPDVLILQEEAAEREYYIRAFRAEETFADSSLSSDSAFRLYQGDMTIPGTACATFYCAVYWLEDRRHRQVFVSVNSF